MKTTAKKLFSLLTFILLFSLISSTAKPALAQPGSGQAGEPAGDLSLEAGAPALLAGQTGYLIRADGMIELFDLSQAEPTGVTIDTQPYGSQPGKSALSPDGKWLYVSLVGSQAVLVINTETQAVITTIALSGTPQGIAFRNDGAYAFVANQSSRTVSVIDVQTHTFVQDISVVASPINVTASPCSDTLYVTIPDRDSLSVIDAQTFTVTKMITAFYSPRDVVFSPFGRLAYVTNRAGDSVAVVDTETNTVIDTWSTLGVIENIVISPDGRTLYIADVLGRILVLDAVSGQELPFLLNPHAGRLLDIAISPAGDQVYISAERGYILVVDTATNQFLASIRVSSDANSLAFTPPSGGCSLPKAILGPQAFTQFGRGGERVSFTQKIFNFTNAPDSFSLSVSSSRWPVSISDAQTALVSPGAWATFTVTVDIPAGAPMGDVDRVQLTAVSTQNPTASEEHAVLETRVVRPGFVVGGNAINMIDTVTHTWLGGPAWTIFLDPYHGLSGPAVLSPDRNTLYTSLTSSDSVAVIDTQAMTVTKTIPVGDFPVGLYLSPDGSRLYIANVGSDTLSVIDTASQTVIQTIPTGSQPAFIAGNACRDKLYVTQNGGNSLAVIDTNSLAVTQVITGLAQPWDVVLSPLGDRAYVGNQLPDSQGRGFISVVDTASEEIIATWPVTGTVGFADIDISPDGQTLYVVDEGGYFIRGLDTLTGAVVSQDEANIEGYTFDIEVFPAEAGPYYYAANPYDPLIAVVNRETNQLEKWILGYEPAMPFFMALFPDSGVCPYPKASLSPQPVTGYGRAGGAVTFTQQISNHSETTASFDLSTSGSLWSVTLSTANTGLIAPGETVTLTVTVDIPADAEIGHFETVKLRAASAVHPLVSIAESNLNIHVIRPGYVIKEDQNKILIVDTFTHSATDLEIDLNDYGDHPVMAVLSPDSSNLYVSMHSGKNVAVIDTQSMTVTKTIPVGMGPASLHLSPNGSRLYVANLQSSDLWVIDTNNLSVIKKIPTGGQPVNVEAHACLDKLYLTQRDENSLAVIDANTLTVTKEITGFDYVWDVVVSPTGDRAYISSQWSYDLYSGYISVLDTTSDEVIATWPVPGTEWLSELDISADGHTLFAAEADRNFIYTIDTTTGEIISEVQVNPSGTTWDLEVFPYDAGPSYYATNPFAPSLAVVNTETHQVEKMVEFKTTGGLRSIALFPASGVCGKRPTAEFTPTSGKFVPGVPVAFTNLSVGTPEPTFTWDFGDGAISTEAHPSHTFMEPGEYTISLTATNLFSSSVFTATLSVGEAPKAKFTPASGKFVTGQAVTFTNLSAGVPGPAYAWDFGDGETSTEASPAHAFAEPGEYTVSLTATNLFSSAVFTATLTLGDAPAAAFTHDQGFILPGQAVNFTNESTGTGELDYTWDFGDESPASHEATPMHTYDALGEYTVSLTVKSDFGEDTVTKVVRVSKLTFVPVLKK